MDVIWLTALETSEPVGIVIARIAVIEQKAMKDAQVVAIHLDTGKEVRVIEALQDVRRRLETGASR